MSRDVGLDLTLRDPLGTPVDLFEATRIRQGGRKIRVRGLVLEATGSYSLEVGGDGPGGYTLSASVSPARVWKRSTR